MRYMSFYVLITQTFRDQTCHYNDVIMSAMASQITSLTIVYATIYLGADQRKHQSPASLDFVRGIHLWLVISPHKWPVTRKMFPFDDVIMVIHVLQREFPIHFGTLSVSIETELDVFLSRLRCYSTFTEAWSDPARSILPICQQCRA